MGTRRLLPVALAAAAAAALSVLPAVPASAAGEAIVPGEVRVDATSQSIGVVWFVAGDTDLDSTMTLEYRRGGESTWRPGAPAVRAVPGLLVDGEVLGIDSWAASALFLDQDASYDLRVTIADPDGGSETRTATGSTSSTPRPGTRIRQVVPGDGGGSGTAADPFRGLQAAADAAQPGDTFRVGAGVYEPFEIAVSGTRGSPIAFVGPGDGSAVVDGDGTDRGAVTIGEFDITTSFVIVQGLTIREAEWGIDAQNTQDIVISGNEIIDVSNGIINRRENDLERRQTVCDNVVVGRTPWPGTGIPSEQGIDVKGYGNTVCHNEVRSFGDCISLEPRSGPSFGNDAFGNDVSRCVDDGIEVDYNQANVRVWENRVTNARTGTSVQPIYGGPAYIFRNEFFNLEGRPIKLNNDPAGLYVAHNTSVKHGNGQESNADWTNTTYRNNFVLGTRYAFEFIEPASQGYRDLDYDAWGTSRAIDPGGPWFKWDDVRYDRIGDLPTGVEDHGVEVGFADLRAATLPADWDVAASVGGSDLRPVADSDAVDAGMVIPNLNDPYVIDGRPDAGAYELGEERRQYGPRFRVGSRFVDVGAENVFKADIEWLAESGITQGCNPPVNNRFCPDDPVTRGQMAAFIHRALAELPTSGDVGEFVDIANSVFVVDIEWLAATGVTRGCNPPSNDRFCPGDSVTRGQMAAFLVRALGLTATDGSAFTDDDGSVFEDDIERLAAAGITRGCNPPSNTLFCPDDPVTRAQMAAFLHRSLGD
jgi:hypothetical protein